MRLRVFVLCLVSFACVVAFGCVCSACVGGYCVACSGDGWRVTPTPRNENEPHSPVTFLFREQNFKYFGLG